MKSLRVAASWSAPWLLASACAAPANPKPLSAAAAVVDLSQAATAAKAPSAAPPQAPSVVQGLQRACDLGAPRACNELGVALLDGDIVATDDERAVRVLQRGCDLKNPAACMNLGFTYAEGRGIAKDESRAQHYYELGCTGDVAPACSMLGQLLDEQDDADAGAGFEYYEKACKLGDKNGCVNAAHVYLDEDFAQHDTAQALRLFTESCDADNGSGCVGEAHMLALGVGVAADSRSALRLYQKGCSLDAYWGCLSYGIALSNGDLGERDLDLARKVLTTSCNAKQAQACSMLESLSEEKK